MSETKKANPNIFQRFMRYFAPPKDESASPYVREGVASNPKSPKKILEDLSKDIDPNVRIQVALNPKTPINRASRNRLIFLKRYFFFI